MDESEVVALGENDRARTPSAKNEVISIWDYAQILNNLVKVLADDTFDLNTREELAKEVLNLFFVLRADIRPF